MELILKHCLTSIEDCEWTDKELAVIFSSNQVYSVLKSVTKKSLLRYSPTSSFLKIYTAWII